MKSNEILIDPDKIEWEEINVSGLKIKTLYENEKTGASIAFVHFEKGFGMPKPHAHASNQFMYVLKGKFTYPGIEIARGMLYINPKDNVHGPSKAIEETIVLEIYDGPHYYPGKKPY
jgi:2,4'-dihydroxyacetophenone dioxygenase